MPRLYIIAGCNGSGKTTASYTMLPQMFQCTEFVNSDEFAKRLSPFNPDHAAVQASRYMLLKIRYLLDKGKDFSIETTLATRSLKKIILEAKKKDYHVTILYFWINSPALAVERVKARVEAGGHNIPEETIWRRYRKGLIYLFEDYMPIADNWILADNSKIPFKVVAQGWKNNMLVKNNLLFEDIRAQEQSFLHEEERRRDGDSEEKSDI